MRQPAVTGAPGSSAAASALGLARTAPSPVLDVRVVLFAVADGELRVALEHGPDGPRLPTGRPSPAEPLDGSARRILREATGLRERYLEQLYTLSVDEPPDWRVIVGYLALAGAGEAGPGPSSGRWVAVGALPPLSAADRMVVDYALLRLRAKLGYTTIAFHLVPPTFTLSELQGAYETILGRRLDKRNFRRRMIASGFLATTDAKRREGSHRPALLHRFRATHDRETYLTPPWAEEGA